MDDFLFDNLTCSSSIHIEQQMENFCCIQLETNRRNLNNNYRNPICEQCHHSRINAQTKSKSQIRILNLSGCYRLTDNGLNVLINNGETEHLNYVDLSGCIQISSESVNHLLSSSPCLSVERLFFCDNLLLSSATSNGCQNVENGSGRFCCRYTK